MSTKFLFAKAVRVANALRFLFFDVFLIFGFPNILMSDNAKMFTGKLFQDFADAWKIRLYFIPKYHASTNNSIERYHRTLKTAIAIYSKQDFRRWDDPVPFLLFSLRNSKNESPVFSPSELVFGKTLRHPFLNNDDLANGNGTFLDINDYKDSLDLARLEMLQSAQKTTVCKKRKGKTQHCSTKRKRGVNSSSTS